MLEGNQRAKIETTDGVIHVVLFHLTYDEKVATSELDIVLGPGYLLTVHEPSWDPRDSNKLRSGIEPVLRHGPDHLLWALADDIVDGYFPFADRLGYAIDDVQDQVVRKATPEVLETLFLLKRELIEVRRAVSPVREVFNQLTNRDIPLIDEEELVYYRDIYDHIIRLTDELDNYRELASATLDVYLSTVNNNLSVIMKRLTGVTVILAGIGAVAGIFGMSEAGTALGGAEAAGFWLVTAITIGRGGHRGDRPAPDRLDLAAMAGDVLADLLRLGRLFAHVPTGVVVRALSTEGNRCLSESEHARGPPTCSVEPQRRIGSPRGLVVAAIPLTRDTDARRQRVRGSRLAGFAFQGAREPGQHPGRLVRRREDEVGRLADLVGHAVRPGDRDGQTVDDGRRPGRRAGPRTRPRRSGRRRTRSPRPGATWSSSRSSASRLPPAERGRRSTTSRPR